MIMSKQRFTMSHDSESLTISLVGHCTPDSFALRSAIAGFYPQAVVENIGSYTDFVSRVDEFKVHLVNRVLDGSFEDESGINLIRRHANDHSALMLISNFPESLQEAIDAGGIQGFGKRDMRGEKARIALHNAINA